MPDWRMATCETNGIEIHYTRTGGNRPPLMLLHGLMANGACWTPVARTLETEYDLIMPDARGHGKSSAPEHGYRYQQLADDVVGLISALKLPPPVLIGHSMGGMTAAVVASQHPALVRGLILADPTFLSTETQREVHESDIVEQHRQALTKSFEQLAADARTRHPARSPGLLDLMARARLQTSLNAFDVLIPPNPDYLQLVRAIDCPTLLVIGDTNSVVSPAIAAELQRHNPELQVTQIRGTGHGLHYDQPDRFTAAVRFFLNALPAL